MIQDISPSRLLNSWQQLQPQPDSFVMCFCEGKLLAALTEEGLQFPRYRECGNAACYLFSVDDEAFFLGDAA